MAAAGGAARVNLATRQAMLVERIAKLYAQAGLRLLPARAARAMPAAMRDFDAGLRSLLAAAPPGEARDAYHLLGLLWEDTRPLATRAPTTDGAKKLAERTEESAWVAAKGAKLLLPLAGTGGVLALHLAGEARMLCQRVAKLYLLRAWIPRSEATLAALVKADAQMRRALEGLAASAAPEVVPELQLAQNQYAFLAPAIERLQQGRGAPADAEAVAKTSDNLLEVMERIARLQESGA